MTSLIWMLLASNVVAGVVLAWRAWGGIGGLIALVSAPVWSLFLPIIAALTGHFHAYFLFWYLLIGGSYAIWFIARRPALRSGVSLVSRVIGFAFALVGMVCVLVFTGWFNARSA
jgi:hypothetical protein